MQQRRSIWQAIQREWQIWRIGALPGLLVIALVLIARLTGTLQRTEWFAFDYLLQLRPAEPIDERILIIGIDEEDIRQLKTYPLSDRTLTQLIQTLQAHEPSVIGLDLFRDLPVEPGHAELMQLFESTPNLIGIEKITAPTIDPPPALPEAQVSFADAVLDRDGFLRRSLLGANDSDGSYQFSFTLQLAKHYLADRNISLDNGIQDPDTMRFQQVELPRLQPNSGAYVGADTGGNQTLLHFRSGEQPFRVVSLQQVMSGDVPDSWIRDQIVLIGVMAPSVKDVVSVAAIQGRPSNLVYGVEVQAHAVSQIISAVLDGRALLHTWSEVWEYLWIVGWGLLGISLGRFFVSPLKLIIGLVVLSTVLWSIYAGLLLWGWWVPVVPAFLALFLNGAGLTTSLFYRYHQDLRSQLHDRQRVIDQTFDAIHNGPLQTLAQILRQAEEQNLTESRSNIYPSHPRLYDDLKDLNLELRSLYESVRRETLIEDSSFYLSADLQLDLDHPMHELLYEVYAYTLSRDFYHFKTLKLTVTSFDPLDDRALTPEQKRGLCRFLEEALCNAGKYAVGMTKLEVVCHPEQGKNVIRVIDNGAGTLSVSQPDQTDHIEQKFTGTGGRGTQQAKELAQQLRGKFLRSANTPQGTICELVWSGTKPWFWQF